MNLADIQPLIIPAHYTESGFDLPHLKLKNDKFIVCWVHHNEKGIAYILKEEYNTLESHHKNWKRIAFENLRKTEYFQRYTKQTDHKELIWICFMNELDAIASSKILLYPELSKIFPEGYRVGIPNRSVGFVISKNCDEANLNEIKELLLSMYEINGAPLSTEIFDGEDFMIDNDLIAPIDIKNSNDIVAFVFTRA